MGMGVQNILRGVHGGAVYPRIFWYRDPKYLAQGWQKLGGIEFPVLPAIPLSAEINPGLKYQSDLK